jgi:hypothetical protein
VRYCGRTPTGLTPKFELTTAQWREVEPSCCPLDAADRKKIVKLVASYYETQPFERSASFEADNKKWLDKVHKTAEGFYRALEELEAESERAGEGLEADERDAAFNAKVLIELRLEQLPWRSIGDFRNATADFIAAAEFAKNKLKDDTGKGFVEGKAWKGLVKGLAQWFDGKWLRVTASKGRIKSNNDKPSHFAAFMHALQLTFPPRLRRHMHSYQALKKAIQRAGQ